MLVFFPDHEARKLVLQQSGLSAEPAQQIFEVGAALALQRFGKDKTTPNDIMVSLREFSVSNEEMGMFWRDTEISWWWYRAPIETQAMMIEAWMRSSR